MRIALIGGKGGVGSTLVGAWKHEHELTVLDHSTEPVDGVRDTVGPAEDPDALAAALDGVDAVVHLAALLPRGTEAEQLPGTAEAVSTNVGAVLLALRMARLAGARSFVHISSLSVFAQYGSTPIPADAQPDATELYGLTKRLAENTLQIAAEEAPSTPEEGPITVTSLRLAYPTTARDWPRWKSPVVPDEDAELLRMEDGTVHPAMHPEDLAAAVWAALNRERGGAFEAVAVTSAPHALDDDAAQRLLGWQPRHLLGPEGPEA